MSFWKTYSVQNIATHFVVLHFGRETAEIMERVGDE
jgi:hypothetical protein